MFQRRQLSSPPNNGRPAALNRLSVSFRSSQTHPVFLGFREGVWRALVRCSRLHRRKPRQRSELHAASNPAEGLPAAGSAHIAVVSRATVAVRSRHGDLTTVPGLTPRHSHGLERSGASSRGCHRPPAHRVYMSTCWTGDIFWLSDRETDPELSSQSSLIAQSPPAAH